MINVMAAARIGGARRQRISWRRSSGGAVAHRSAAWRRGIEALSIGHRRRGAQWHQRIAASARQLGGIASSASWRQLARRHLAASSAAAASSASWHQAASRHRRNRRQRISGIIARQRGISAAAAASSALCGASRSSLIGIIMHRGVGGGVIGLIASARASRSRRRHLVSRRSSRIGIASARRLAAAAALGGGSISSARIGGMAAMAALGASHRAQRVLQRIVASAWRRRGAHQLGIGGGGSSAAASSARRRSSAAALSGSSRRLGIIAAARISGGMSARRWRRRPRRRLAAAASWRIGGVQPRASISGIGGVGISAPLASSRGGAGGVIGGGVGEKRLSRIAASSAAARRLGIASRS